MRTMKIFEHAMCCPTGLCGVGVDPELLRVSTVLNTLKQNGVEVQRFNLTNAPMEFVNEPVVSDYLKKFGPEKLPVVVVDGMIVIAGRYPTNVEFTEWLELSADVLGIQGGCCGEASFCCCGEENIEESNCCCSEESVKEDGCCCGSEEVSSSEENTESGCCCGGGSCC